MLYHLHEIQKAAAFPAHQWSEANRIFFDAISLKDNFFGSYIAAGNEMLERSTRIFNKPDLNLKHFSYTRNGVDHKVDVRECIIKDHPFCSMIHFQRYNENGEIFGKGYPKVLIVAPLSGHYASLLRDTVQRFLPHHNVYLTDWKNARDIPLQAGPFHLDDYADLLIDMITLLHGNVHIIAVCQPVVPVLMAATYLAQTESDVQPKSMTLMGGPVDARINPGKVNDFGKNHTMEWFHNNIIDSVPAHYQGAGRLVCPGFIMLEGFLALNIERHQEASTQLFKHLVQGDMETVENHNAFYDEYRAVMDIPAEYYLESIEKVFQTFELPRGKMKYRDICLDLKAIQKTHLLTVEGARDDISCVGQTYAAQELCAGLASSQKDHFLQQDVGHYGIFNGRRFREFIYPKIASFIKNAN